MKRPFAYIGFSFASALLVLNAAGAEYAFVLSAGAAAVFAASIALPKYRKEKIFPLCFGSVLFACIVYICVYYSSVNPARFLDGKEALATFYITDIPKKSEYGYVYTVKTSSIKLDGAVQNVKIILSSDRPIRAGAYRAINARLKFRFADMKAFLDYGYWGKGIFLKATLGSCRVTETVVNKAGFELLNLREDIIKTLTNAIGGDAGAFSAALITGFRQGMTDDTIDAFTSSGTLHLTAVSGLHLCVLTGAVRGLLNILGTNRRVSSFVSILFVIFFSALTGFSSSVVRAGIMMIVFFLGGLLNARSDSLNSLGLAVFVICLNPFAVTDPGAVLSVLSVLAILTSPKALTAVNGDKKFKKKTSFLSEVAEYIAEGVTASLFILLYTLPAQYIFFKSFSVIGILMNVFVVPLGSLSVVMSMLAYFLNKLNFFSGAFNAALSALNNFIIALVKTAGSFSFSSVKTGNAFGFVLAFALAAQGMSFITRNKTAVKYTARILSVLLIGLGVLSAVLA